MYSLLDTGELTPIIYDNTSGFVEITNAVSKIYDKNDIIINFKINNFNQINCQNAYIFFGDIGVNEQGELINPTKTDYISVCTNPEYREVKTIGLTSKITNLNNTVLFNNYLITDSDLEKGFANGSIAQFNSYNKNLKDNINDNIVFMFFTDVNLPSDTKITYEIYAR